MTVLFLLALAASVQAITPDILAGQYVAVTETEYAITLAHTSSGRAQYDSLSWEADGSAPEVHERFAGKWSRSGDTVIVQLSSGETAIYPVVPCLSYEEFREAGCSPGLGLVDTTLADRDGLKRFGLWNASSSSNGAQS